MPPTEKGEKHGEKDAGGAHRGAARAGHVEEADSQDQAHVDGIRLRGVRHRGRARHQLGGRRAPDRRGSPPAVLPRQGRPRERLRGPGPGPRAQGDGQGRREPSPPARRAQREAPARGQGRDGPHEVLRRLRNLDGGEKSHRAHRARGWAVVRGRLVGPHAGEGPGEPRCRRGLEDLPVRGRAAVQPDGPLRADAQHEGGDAAQAPRAHARVPGRRARAHGMRQDQGRRREAPPRGGGSCSTAPARRSAGTA